jgi:hypothetical protein
MHNYRVIRREGQYSIHEIFMSDDGRIVGYSQDASSPAADTIDDLKKSVEQLKSALSQPVLEHSELESEAEKKRQTTG